MTDARGMSGGISGRADGGQTGLTLLELLIALTLMALLSMMLLGGIQMGTRVWEKTGEATDNLEEVRIATTFLRRNLAAAYPALDLSDPANPVLEFQGEVRALSFLAPMPLALGGGGMARMALSADGDVGEQRLLLHVRPELAADDFPAIADRALLDHLADVRFSYYGAPRSGEPEEWREIWRSIERLPRLIRVEVEYPEGDKRIWPDFVVAPRVDIDAMCSYDPLTKACQGR